MDIDKIDIAGLESILNGDNELKAEFARQFMPHCTSEDEFHATLRDMIKEMRQQAEDIAT